MLGEGGAVADIRKLLPQNADGEFFVDSTCVNCDTCRQLAPATFGDTGDYAYVRAQPATVEERRNALRALLCCPEGSIGTRGPNDAREVMADFPLELDDGVYYCGFNSPKSFGGNSYFVRHPDGNWLIDSPKYLPRLVQRFEEMGGVRYIFLTHRDDVAEAALYAERFGGRRIIHRADLDAQPDAEVVVEGDAPTRVQADFLVIPTPGHTEGHCVLLHRDRYLFTGDHLWWDRQAKRLGASQDVCWYSWDEQRKSMANLLGYTFEWVLPGHGQRMRLPADEMARHLAALAQRM